LKSAEEKGFEPLVALPPRRFSKPAVSRAKSKPYARKGTIGERAFALLESLRAGSCTESDVAQVAAEVLSDPPPIVLAAQRFLAAVGTPGAGAAAVAFLELAAVYTREDEAAHD
jgi:hypothetical protein